MTKTRAAKLTLSAGDHQSRSFVTAATARNEKPCRLCGEPLDVSKQGRPRRFCSSSHRVAFHRLQRVCSEAELAAAVMAWRTSHPVVEQPPREHPTCTRSEALDDLADLLEDLQPLRRLAHLQHLGELAEDLLTALDASAGLTWALGDDLWEVRDELVQLEDHRQTIMELVNLYWLADRCEGLMPLVRKLQQRVDDLRVLSHEHAPEEDRAPWRAS